MIRKTMAVVALLCLSSGARATDPTPTAVPTGDGAMMYIGTSGAWPSGDVSLDAGWGFDLGVGYRMGAFTGMGFLGGSTHHISDGGKLALTDAQGDTLSYYSDWDFTSVGLVGQYSFHTGHRAQPFVMAGLAFAHFTHGGDDNVEGSQVSAGAGCEFFLRRKVSFSATAQVDQVHAWVAKGGGQSFDLAEAIDETVFKLKIGMSVYLWSGEEPGAPSNRSVRYNSTQ